jgi:hypothetical protein
MAQQQPQTKGYTLTRIIDPKARESLAFSSDWPSLEAARAAALRKAREMMVIADEAAIKRRIAPLADLAPGRPVTVDKVLWTLEPA